MSNDVACTQAAGYNCRRASAGAVGRAHQLSAVDGYIVIECVKLSTHNKLKLKQNSFKNCSKTVFLNCFVSVLFRCADSLYKYIYLLTYFNVTTMRCNCNCN